ncbi:uncharacterized protein LOC110861711 [Folsomia candida]|uniref:uncharacterized protein LOC110861711 n=1 Tax=Folsomia candida TaxID=158441 RepID=UPI001604A9A5|nr:uncharacterized protein LOC110861711 [Folsomia candida]
MTQYLLVVVMTTFLVTGGTTRMGDARPKSEDQSTHDFAWGLIIISALVSAFFFCILPLWVCFCYRKGAEPQNQIIYIQGRAPPGYQQLTSLP